MPISRQASLQTICAWFAVLLVSCILVCTKYGPYGSCGHFFLGGGHFLFSRKKKNAWARHNWAGHNCVQTFKNLEAFLFAIFTADLLRRCCSYIIKNATLTYYTASTPSCGLRAQEFKENRSILNCCASSQRINDTYWPLGTWERNSSDAEKGDY